MSMIRSLKTGGIVAASALFLVLGAASPDAMARDGAKARGKATERAQGSYTRTTTRQRTENGRTRNDTWTGANGRSATRDAVVTNDREAGTRTRNVDYTGPNGNTRSVDTVTTRTDSGFQRNTTATNAEGQTATRDATLTRDASTGTVTRSANYTTFDGRTGSYESERTRTDDGYTRDVTRNLPNGETRSRSIDVSCDKDAKSCTKTVDVNGGAPQGE
jgi:hypothetical protein